MNPIDEGRAHDVEGLIERLIAEVAEQRIMGEPISGHLVIEAISLIHYLRDERDACGAKLWAEEGKRKAAEAEVSSLRDRVTELEKKEKQAFDVGYTLAVSNLINLHDQPGMAADVIVQSDITLRKIEAMGLTDYDLKPLRKMFRTEHVLRAVKGGRDAAQ